MAERRMFAKAVVESARLLKMPPSSQNLYFHLGLNADDDGIVEAYTVINLIKAHEDDLRVLLGKGFIKILDEDLVTYIKDWRKHNYIRADRKKDSIYQDRLLQIDPSVDLLERKERSDLAKKTKSSAGGEKTAAGPSMDTKMSAQCSVGKGSISKDSIVECSVPLEETHTVLYRLDHETLTECEYNDLVARYTKKIVDGVINRIIGKPYHGCLNTAKISKWCSEQVNTDSSPVVENGKSRHSDQLMKLASERAGE